MTDLRVMEIPLAEVLSTGSRGRQPSPRDLALDALVLKASLPESADTAFTWAYAPDKKMTAIAAAKRAIERNKLIGKVWASTKGDTIIFAQQPLRKPRSSR